MKLSTLSSFPPFWWGDAIFAALWRLMVRMEPKITPAINKQEYIRGFSHLRGEELLIGSSIFRAQK